MNKSSTERQNLRRFLLLGTLVTILVAPISKALEVINIPPTSMISSEQIPIENENANLWLSKVIRNSLSEKISLDKVKDLYERDKFEGLKLFVSVVRKNSKWDYKFQFNDLETKKVLLGNQRINVGALGNITHGYYASYVGIPEILILAGPGLYERIDHPDLPLEFWDNKFKEFTWFDKPEDQKYIRFGIRLYERYPDPKELTEKKIEALAVTFFERNPSDFSK